MPPGPPTPWECVELPAGGPLWLSDIPLPSVAAWSVVVLAPADAAVDDVPVHPAKTATASTSRTEAMNPLVGFMEDHLLFSSGIPPGHIYSPHGAGEIPYALRVVL